MRDGPRENLKAAAPRSLPAGSERGEPEAPQVLTRTEADQQLSENPPEARLQELYDAFEAQKEAEGRDYTLPESPPSAPAAPDAPNGEFDPNRKEPKIPLLPSDGAGDGDDDPDDDVDGPEDDDDGLDEDDDDDAGGE